MPVTLKEIQTPTVMNRKYLVVAFFGAFALLLALDRPKLDAAAAGGSDDARVDALEKRVAQLESKLGRDKVVRSSAPAIAPRLTNLERDVAELKRSFSPTHSKYRNSDSAKLTREVSELKRSVTSLDRKVADTSKTLAGGKSSSDFNTLSREVDRLRRELDTLKRDVQRIDRN
jgi:polyhydroxyalkanoate synthesis regulator phasin